MCPPSRDCSKGRSSTLKEKSGRKRHVEREEDNNVSSCQRGSRTFTATHCSQYFLSTVRTVVSLWLWWCLRCIRLLCFAEFVIFFLLSHTLNSSLRLPLISRADTRRELTELQPFNLTHVLADVPNGKDFNEVLQNTRASQ